MPDPIAPSSVPHPRSRRYVALGDSFTEGVGDPDPDRPRGLRGWADRVAEVLGQRDDEVRYANLAVRGKLMRQVLDEQVGPALALGPDLVTLHAGANDVLRPRVDLDGLAAAYDETVGRIREAGAQVVLFTIADPGSGGLYSALRGRMAIFNEHVREIVDTRGALLVDPWRMRSEPVADLFDTDRMHLNARGHALVAARVLDVLGVEHDLRLPPMPPRPVLARRERLRQDATWAREFALPWVRRRLTGRSSGDGLPPRRPDLAPAPTPPAPLRSLG